MNALAAETATVTQRRRSSPGRVSTGVSLVAMARPSRIPPSTVRRVLRAVASRSTAAAVMPTAITSTWALLPASRATVGHHDHSAAIRTSRPSRPRPNTSSPVVSTAASAVAAWMGVLESSAGCR